MKILIPALTGATQPDGVCRHAINLAHCLLLQSAVERVDLVAGDWQRSFFEQLTRTTDQRLHLHFINSGRSSLARNLWYYRHLPRLAAHLESDLVHLSYPVPIHRSRYTCPVVTTLHDLYPHDIPENFGYPRVLLNRLILQQCLDAVDGIACVSQTTLDRLRLHSPRSVAKASLVPNCVESSPVSASSPIPGIGGEPFILSVAQHRRNKNIPLTLAVFRRLLAAHPDLRLILVGRRGPETAVIHAHLRDRILRDRVLLFEGISEEQLQWCYRQAELLLATSSIEGFGLPVAEAQLAGCRVVCTDIAAFREVSGAHCCLVPADSEALVDAVERSLKTARPQPVSLPWLSRACIARRYMDLYRDLLSLQPVPIDSRLRLEDRKGILS